MHADKRILTRLDATHKINLHNYAARCPSSVEISNSLIDAENDVAKMTPRDSPAVWRSMLNFRNEYGFFLTYGFFAVPGFMFTVEMRTRMIRMSLLISPERLAVGGCLVTKHSMYYKFSRANKLDRGYILRDFLLITKIGFSSH